MRLQGLAAIIGLWIGAGCGSARGAPMAPAPAARPLAGACPYETPAAWQAFLERGARDPRWVKTCEDNTCDDAYYAFVKESVEGVLERCAGVIARDPAISACTRNLRAFVPTWMEQHDETSYGFAVDNHTYLTDQESADKPEGMMRPPEALVAALPLRARLTEAAREHGFRYLTHDSALGGVRTFLYIPDPAGRFDQWILLNFQDGADPVIDAQTPMSFIAVQKKDRANHPLPHVRLHFRDYSMDPGEGGYRLSLQESSNGKCYACHVSGMRQLIARRTPVLEALPVQGEPGYRRDQRAPRRDFSYQRLQELNSILRSYGLPDWQGRVMPERHGPVLGEAQGCTSCHDGHTRGVLTVSTSVAQLERKMSLELSMPPERGLPELVERSEMKNPALSPEERERLEEAKAAHRRLVKDFEDTRAPSLTRWLLETRCR